MGFDDRTRDREADPAPAARPPRPGFINPIEPVEDLRQVLRRDAETGIADADLDLITGRPGCDHHLAALRCVLKRVPNEIDEHLRGAILVGEHLRESRRRFQFQRDVFGFRLGSKPFDDGEHQRGDIDRPELKPNRTRLHPAEFLQIVDQAVEIGRAHV